MGNPTRWNEILGALSLATDLGAGVADEAALRTCVIATALAERMGLGAAQRRDVYYTAVLRYLGCSGYAHEEARIGAGDDHHYLSTFEDLDPTELPALLGRAVTRLARHAPLAERVRSVGLLLSDPKAYASMADAHCAQAVSLAAAFGLGPGVQAALGEIYERWDGRGAPHRRAGDRLSLTARVLHVACVVEVLHRVAGPRAAVDAVRARLGRALDPAVADAFLSGAAEVLARVEPPSVWDDYLASEPTPGLALDPAQLDDAALSFARYVDLKCPFTLGHSTGVASLGAAAAGELGLGAEAVTRLRRAGWLHDLGRVSVPNGVWEKPGALNAPERDRVEGHARHGERILARSPALADVAALVGRHHERVDGSGYPRGAQGGALDAAAKVLAAADVMQALGSERPWRPAHPADEVARRMREEVTAGRLDAEAVRAVMRAGGLRDDRVRAAYPMGLSEREVEVLRLLARGMTNPAIGRKLFISPRTVQQHVRNLYAKAGVSTRAAAALFATTHDLT